MKKISFWAIFFAVFVAVGILGVDLMSGDASTGSGLDYAFASEQAEDELPEVGYAISAADDRPYWQATDNEAVVRGFLHEMGDADRVDVWIEWGDREDDLENQSETKNLTDTGAFDVEFEGLDPDTTYYYRSVAENEHGTTSAEEVASFTTVSDEVTAPKVETLGVMGVEDIELIGSVRDPGGVNVDSVDAWFEWGESEDLGRETEKETFHIDDDIDARGDFIRERLEVSLGHLDGGRYFYRAVAENESYRGEGEILSFKVDEDVDVENTYENEQLGYKFNYPAGWLKIGRVGDYPVTFRGLGDSEMEYKGISLDIKRNPEEKTARKKLALEHLDAYRERYLEDGFGDLDSERYQEAKEKIRRGEDPELYTQSFYYLNFPESINMGDREVLKYRLPMNGGPYGYDYVLEHEDTILIFALRSDKKIGATEEIEAQEEYLEETISSIEPIEIEEKPQTYLEKLMRLLDLLRGLLQ